MLAGLTARPDDSILWVTRRSEVTRYHARMNVTRHFSDTRTDEGRVRFLLCPGAVQLLAEGHGWHHASTHATLHDAATYLAVIPQVPQALYEEALAELDRRTALELRHAA